MTGKVEKVLEELASLTPEDEAELVVYVSGNTTSPELAALLARLVARVRVVRGTPPEAHVPAANENSLPRPAFRTADLLALAKNVEPDPEFADDVEAGIRARREADESRRSPWEP